MDGAKGSYKIAVNTNGDGFVSITELNGLGEPTPNGTSFPEPASLALFGTGLSGLGLIRRQRRRG